MRHEVACDGLVNVVVLAGTVAADPVQRRMPSGDEVTQCRWLDGIGSNGWSGWSSLGSSQSRCWESSRCWAEADASGSLRSSCPLERSWGHRAPTLRSGGGSLTHNFPASAHPRPARTLGSTPFRRFWLAAKRSGVRIPLGPQTHLSSFGRLSSEHQVSLDTDGVRGG
jgi:hypothetical protein